MELQREMLFTELLKNNMVKYSTEVAKYHCLPANLFEVRLRIPLVGGYFRTGGRLPSIEREMELFQLSELVRWERNRCIIPNFIIPNGRFSYAHYSYIAIFLRFKIPKVQNS